MTNEKQIAIDILPQVAEKNTPWPMDVTREGLYYYEL
jgi:hypothetical protein